MKFRLKDEFRISILGFRVSSFEFRVSRGARRPCQFPLQPFHAPGKSLAVSKGRELLLKTGEAGKGEFERLRNVAKVMFIMDGKLLERFESQWRLAPRKLQP